MTFRSFNDRFTLLLQQICVSFFFLFFIYISRAFLLKKSYITFLFDFLKICKKCFIRLVRSSDLISQRPAIRFGFAKIFEIARFVINGVTTVISHCITRKYESIISNELNSTKLRY